MAQTDKFRKIKSLFSTTLVSGIGTGTGDTITLNSAAGLPTDTEITLTFNRVDSDGADNATSEIERITGTISGATLTSYTRGIDGTTEQAHGAGTVVESIWIGDDWNDAVDGILVGHDQDGGHATDAIDAITEIASALKSGSDTTLITGTAGTDTYTAVWNADGDLVDGADPSLYALAANLSTDGWLDSADTWTYASATSFTIAGADRTAQLQKGTRIKLTNDGGTDYYIVASSSFSTNTTVNLAPTDDYALANSAITNPQYSYADSPQGFPQSFAFTTTYTGFSSDPTGVIDYSVSGGFCNVVLASGAGTSNSATFNIILPIAPNYTDNSYHPITCPSADNGTWGNGVLGLNHNSTTAKFGKQASTISGNAYGGYTTSGNKSGSFSVVYPI